jgi:putative intracellular protease/amidase
MTRALSLNATSVDTPKKILLVIANPARSTTLGIPVGFWGAELTHSWFEFEDAGYDVTIASPDGGKCELDAWSDPRDESKYSFGDLITMGFLNTPEYMQLIDDTPALSELNYADYDALVVVGGQSPMFTFRDHEELKNALRTFYEAGKVTSALCHGTAALIDLTLSDGSYLIAGKTMTGFANVEEQFADEFVGTQVMPWHIEDAAKERGANYIQGGRFKPFAIRDGNLITGQQQYSGNEVAKLVIETLGK